LPLRFIPDSLNQQLRSTAMRDLSAKIPADFTTVSSDRTVAPAIVQ